MLSLMRNYPLQEFIGLISAMFEGREVANVLHQHQQCPFSHIYAYFLTPKFGLVGRPVGAECK